MIAAATLRRHQERFAGKVARSRQSHTHFQDRDLHQDLARFWALPTIERLKAERRSIGCAVADVPTLWLRRVTTQPRTWGTAHAAFQHIKLVLYPELSVPQVLAILLHEVVHCALPDREAHSWRFWTRLQEATLEAWPGIVFPHSLLWGTMSERNRRHIETVVAHAQTGGTL